MILKIKKQFSDLRKLVLSSGFKYRWGIRIKDFGERVGHINIFGLFFLSWVAGPIIGFGLKMKDAVLSRPIVNGVA